MREQSFSADKVGTPLRTPPPAFYGLCRVLESAFVQCVVRTEAVAGNTEYLFYIYIRSLKGGPVFVFFHLLAIARIWFCRTGHVLPNIYSKYRSEKWFQTYKQWSAGRKQQAGSSAALSARGCEWE